MRMLLTSILQFSEPDTPSNTNLCIFRLLVGTFDPSAGRFTLSGVFGSSISRMEPRIQGVKYEADGTESRKEVDSSDLLTIRRERNAKLIEAFGSQRRKRQLANAGKVDATQLSAGDAMLNIIRSTKSDPGKREDVIKTALSDRNIPPHNAAGTTADEAYPFNLIIPASVYDSIDSSLLVQALADRSILGDVRSRFGPYVASRVGGANTLNESAESFNDRIRCLAFLGHLLSFLTNPKRLLIRIQTDSGGISSVAEGLQMPASTLEGILGLFYSREDMEEDGTKYIMDKRKRNLLLAWCLVLAVRAEQDSFLPSFAFQNLTEQLKMKSAEVASIFRELGCQTKRANQSYAVSLLRQIPGEDPVTLDMSFPSLKLGGRKR